MTIAPAFERWLARLRKWEGRDSDDPHDRGGPTRYGVTKIKLDELHAAGKYRHIQWPPSEAEAAEIARGEYWNKAGCGLLEWPLSFVVADLAFNSGAHRAVKFLQAIVGAGADGRFGDATLAACTRACVAYGAKAVALEVHIRRTRFVAQLHQDGDMVRGEHDIETENKFLEGLMVRLVEAGFVVGEG